jgi:LysM repeat protein
MSKWPASWRIILLIVSCCLLSGCLPVSDSPIDDEKDPNLIEAHKLYNMFDMKGAAEAYARTIQANPRNATAYFELAVLEEQKLNDFISAAYHYQKHLELRPNSPYRDRIIPRLDRCKMEIARSVTFVVVTDQVHKDLAKLTNDLAVANKQNETLRAYIAAKPTVVTQWMKFTVTNYVTNFAQLASAQVGGGAASQLRTYPSNTLTRTNPAGLRVTPLPASTATNRLQRPTTTTTPTTRLAEFHTTPAPLPAPTQTKRTYTVRSGETMAEVARKFGVSLAKLQAANPTIEPRRLRAGQTLNLPSQ